VTLKAAGLQREVKRSQWHDFVPVLHYRFDQDALREAANQFFSEGTPLKVASSKDTRTALSNESKRKKLPQTQTGLCSEHKAECAQNTNDESCSEHNSYKEISREYKEILLPTANAVAESAAHSHNIIALDESEYSAQAESSISVEAPTDAKSTDTTTPSIPNSAPPLSPAELPAFARWRKQAYPGARLPKGAMLDRWHAEFRADPHYQQWMDEETRQDGVQRSAKQLARDESLKIAMNALAQAMKVTLVKADEKRYSQIAQILVGSTIPYSEFETFVRRLEKKAKEEGSWTVTVESLIKNGRPSEYVTAREEYRKKQAVGASQGPWTGSTGASSVSYHQAFTEPVKSRPVMTQEERIAALEEIKREGIS